MGKNILIRCITEPSKGYGNFTRSLTLAQNLKRRGHKVTFLINSNSFIQSILENKNFNFFILSKKFSSTKDTKFLLNFLKKNDFKLLILDMREYSEYISKQTYKIIPTILIDDAFCKNIYADIAINGSINKQFQKYNVKNKNSKLFLGPDFFMANESFKKNQKLSKHFIKKSKYTVLVSIGGSDPTNLTLHVLNSIINLPNIKFKIIVGPFFKNISKIKNLIKNKKNIEIKFSPKNISKQFMKADVVISKSGITLYELAIMGIPTICISSFKHEEPSAKKFMSKNSLIHLGMQKSVSEKKISNTLINLLNDTKKRKLLSSNAKKIVDGKGLSRVTKIIELFLKNSN